MVGHPTRAPHRWVGWGLWQAGGVLRRRRGVCGARGQSSRREICCTMVQHRVAGLWGISVRVGERMWGRLCWLGLLAAAAANQHAAQVGHEADVRGDILQVHVHAVAPVVLGVGGVVDHLLRRGARHVPRAQRQDVLWQRRQEKKMGQGMALSVPQASLSPPPNHHTQKSGASDGADAPANDSRKAQPLQ